MIFCYFHGISYIVFFFMSYLIKCLPFYFVFLDNSRPRFNYFVYPLHETPFCETDFGYFFLIIFFFFNFHSDFYHFFPSCINFEEFCLLFLLSLNVLHLSLGWLLGFIISHVWMWELDCEESWAWENLCFWTVVLEKTLGLKEDPTSPS